jgi:GNAT superfamily N-acetyltransferase
VDPCALSLDSGYHADFLTSDEVWRYAGDPQYDLPEGFVQRALRAGDECFAVRKDDVLVSYGWYASRGTNSFSATLRLSFDPQWIYLYRAFTHPAYRGRRFNAVAVTRALATYRGRGRRGLLACIDAANTASLKSFHRMGFRAFGTMYTMKLGRLFGQREPKVGLLRRDLVCHSLGCRRFAFRLRDTASAARPSGDDIVKGNPSCPMPDS